MPCLSQWHYTILEAKERGRGVGQLKVPGCPQSLGNVDVVPCAPETMRAAVEAQLRKAGLWSGTLSLGVYGLARNLMSEAGRDATPEELVALGEAAMNRGWPEEKRVLMRDGSRFSKQRGSNPAASTSQDPYFEHIVAAHLVLARQTGNFAAGATHYFDSVAQDAVRRRCIAAGTPPDDCAKSALEVLESWTAGGAAMWIGPRPGIDPRYQMFLISGNAVRASYKTVEGRKVWEHQLAAAKAALAAKGPDQRTGVYDLPPCAGAGMSSSGTRTFLAIAAAAMGAIGTTLATAYLARVWRLKRPYTPGS